MNGWRRFIQIARSRAMSGRFCSLARKSFFVRQAEPVQQAPDGRPLHIDPSFLPECCDTFIKRHGRMIVQLGSNPVMLARKLAMTASSLRLGLQPTGFSFQPHHVVDELDGYAKTPGRFGVRIALFDQSNCAFT